MVHKVDMAKYDRQIRLFGMETQKKLRNMTVQVYGSGSAIVGEIVKNLVLLGVNWLILQKAAELDYDQLVPNKMAEINELVTVQYEEEIVKSDFLFIVGEMADLDRTVGLDSAIGTPYYFVCSRHACHTLRKSAMRHECRQDGSADTQQNGPESIQAEVGLRARQCLIGAFAVQEFLKAIQGKRHVAEYNFDQ